MSTGINTEKELIIFEFIPFDGQIHRTELNEIPKEMNTKQVLEYLSSNAKVLELGLFIAHCNIKSRYGAFIRFTFTSANPPLYKISVFNENFQLCTSMEDVEINEVDKIEKSAKGLRLFVIMGTWDEDEEDEG